jgi:hypothetical protein
LHTTLFLGCELLTKHKTGGTNPKQKKQEFHAHLSCTNTIGHTCKRTKILDPRK